MKQNRITRRRLLQTVGASSLIFPFRSQAQGSKKLGVALVGLGYYSRDLLAPALQHTQYCELRGIVTGSPGKIPVWQRKYNIEDSNVYNYDTMHRLADNDDIDVVYVVVPTALHLKYAAIGANAGKHIWCEKPMAMNVSECEEIIRACEKNKVRLSIGYRMQHEPNTQTVISYAKTQPYGKIQGLNVSAGYGGSGGPEDYWRMQKHMGGGAMYDMGVYAVNASRYATQMEPSTITARHHNPVPEVFKEVDPTTYFDLDFPGGVRAECMTSVIKNENYLQVNAEKGWYGLKPLQSYSGVVGRTSDGKKLNKFIANQQTVQMDNDALSIMKGSPMLVPGEEGLKDIRIVEAAFQSAASGKAVSI